MKGKLDIRALTEKQDFTSARLYYENTLQKDDKLWKQNDPL